MTAGTRGRFITLEGGEGAGKSTHIALLADALAAGGIDVLTTREPGGSPGAEAIRGLLVEGAVDRWDAMTEALLHYAARRDHLTATVWPALESGRWVLSDRFADSTMAYQGYGHGLDRAVVAALHQSVVGDFRPDLTLILDLPPETGLARAAGRGPAEARYERMDLSFHQRLREGFLDIARQDTARCVVVDAEPVTDAVQKEIRRAVSQRLGLDLT